jgi:pimeloyl-ACP methyl ester carboxylesterase
MTTFVLVHGSNSNSFAWVGVQRELALRGFRSLAVDLPGHGLGATFPKGYQGPQDLAELRKAPAPIAKITVREQTDHVVDTVKRVAENGPVVLVGHSRGGTVITAVGNAVPELIDRIVYVSAWCPAGKTVQEYGAGPENADSALNNTMDAVVADPAELGALRLNLRTADPDLLARLKHAMFDDGTDQEFMACLNILEPDEMLDLGDMVRPETWGRIPRTYVRLTKDLSMPLALQDSFISNADALMPDNPFQVHDIESSHVRFLFHPKEFVDILTRSATGA